MSDLIHALRKCVCDNGHTRESGGNPMSGGILCEKCRLRRQAANRIEQLESELARLRKAIQEAPHAQFCETETMNFRTEQARRENIKGCSCWKRNAQEGEE